MIETSFPEEGTVAGDRLLKQLPYGASALAEAKVFAIYLALTTATQEELAQKLGRERTYVTHRLMLLDLDDETRGLLERGDISYSQALALHQIENWRDRADLARRVQREKATVRTLRSWIEEYREEV